MCAIRRSGKHQLALSQYQAGLRRLARSGVVLSNRAMCAVKLGDLQAAVLDSSAALLLDGKHAKSHLRCATALLGLTWLQEAQVGLVLRVAGPNG